MTVYIEYAFLQNFLFDKILLFLAMCVAGVRISKLRLVLSATLGAVFALVYPFLSLSTPMGLCLKTAVALSMIWLANGRIKTKKDRGRYALSAVFFFVFTFAFGGVMSYFNAYMVWSIFLSFACLTVFSLWLVKILRRRGAWKKFVYSCEICFRDKTVRADGFFDSGNGAEKFGMPVCFLTPDLAFDLFEGVEGQERFHVQTIAGEKSVKLYTANLKTYDGRRLVFSGEVYFAPSANMIGKEYKILLNRALMEGESA